MRLSACQCRFLFLRIYSNLEFTKGSLGIANAKVFLEVEVIESSNGCLHGLRTINLDVCSARPRCSLSYAESMQDVSCLLSTMIVNLTSLVPSRRQNSSRLVSIRWNVRISREIIQDPKKVVLVISLSL